jgi:hypothetical protein
VWQEGDTSGVVHHTDGQGIHPAPNAKGRILRNPSLQQIPKPLRQCHMRLVHHTSLASVFQSSVVRYIPDD